MVLHLASSLGPYLFALVMKDITIDISKMKFCCVCGLVIDVWCSLVTREQLNDEIECWRKVIESNKLRSKTEYMDASLVDMTYESR